MVGEESPSTPSGVKSEAKEIAANGRLPILSGRDSVTETIPPIIVAKTLKVFASEEARVKRGGVRAHSARWQQRAVKNSYPVQGTPILIGDTA